MKTIIFFVLCFIGAIVTDDACLAPPGVYGKPCISSRGLVSGCCSLVEYSVDVKADTNVMCQALGTGEAWSGSNCTFGWYGIGIVNSGNPYPLGWSASAGTPAISCMSGGPGMAALTWTWTSRASNLYCPMYCTQGPCHDSSCLCQDVEKGNLTLSEKWKTHKI